jgi:ADP-heptose:LPS heptosyltransferase
MGARVVVLEWLWLERYHSFWVSARFIRSRMLAYRGRMPGLVERARRRLRWGIKRLAQGSAYLALGTIGWVLARRAHDSTQPPLRLGMFRPRRILLIRLDLIGDLVHTTPAIRALRRAYPEAKIHLLATPSAAGVLAGDPDIDCVLTYDPHAWLCPGALRHAAVYSAALALLHTLRANRYDLCVSVCGDWASIWARLSGARRRVGYRNEAYPYFLTDPVPGGRMQLPERGEKLNHGGHRGTRRKSKNPLRSFVSSAVKHLFPLSLASPCMGLLPALYRHEVAAVLALAKAAGATIEPADYVPRLHIDPAAAAEVTALLASHGVASTDMVVVAHVSAANGRAKRWPVEHWAALGDRLIAELGVRFALMGAENDRPLTRAVQEAMGERPIDLAGATTLPQLVALLARAQLVVSGDSGPLHIARAVGTPIVAIYGPTDPAISGPVGSPAIVLRRDLWCSPCYNPRATAECRYGNPICMQGVRPDQVFDAARHLLERERRPAATRPAR